MENFGISKTLRLGNYVQTDKHIHKVVRLSLFTVNNKPEWNFKGVSLTDELLLKCGFRKTNNEFYKDDLWFTIHVYINSIEVVFNYDMDIAVEVKYLHELQNIIWNLAGQELEINL